MLQPQPPKNSIFYDDKYKYLKTISKNGFNEICLCFDIFKQELFILKVALPQFFEISSINIEKQSIFHKKLYGDTVVKFIEFKISGKKIVSKSTNSKNKNNSLNESPQVFTNKCSYLVLEYVQQGELFDYVKYNKGLYFKIALYYFKSLILSLEEMHNKNICHRDIKLENLLLDSNFTLKICDFEFSEEIYRDFENKEYKFHIDKQGTFAYMAPEFYVSRILKDPNNDSLKNSYTIFHTGDKIDIFACGVVLFIMLTGGLPFISAETTDKNYRLLKDYKYDIFWKSKKFSIIKHNIPECAKDLLNKIFEFDPEKRISIEDIKKHEFYTEGVPSQEEIKLYMHNIWLLMSNRMKKN
jgi:serine/threonine protein kinase